jgi:HEAT repeat protein
MSSSSLDASALQQSFIALKTYDSGSGRAALLPLDSAVASASANPAQAVELERRLLTALQTCTSEPARRYLCAKLALLGSESAVSALAGFLSDPHLATAARNALEDTPGKRAAEALRDCLTQAGARIGAINSLGAIRDQSSVRALTAFLKSDTQVEASAAIAALGEIGSPRAARVLRAFYPKAPEDLRPALADAILFCAETLAATGHGPEATTLYRLLDSPQQPKHVREPAARGLQTCKR